MKILFVAFRHNPLNNNSGSGTASQFYKSFCEYGHQVRVIGPFNQSPILFERYLQYLYRKCKRKYIKYKWTSTFRASYMLNKVESIWNPDIIFSLAPSPFIFYRGTTPYVIRTDTTFLGMNMQAPQYLLHDKFMLKQMVWQERKAFSDCSMIITHSDWSKKILKKYYKVKDQSIYVLPNPAGFNYIRNDSQREKKCDYFPKVIRLLIVGRDYSRKGIDIAINIVNLLNKRGLKSHLKIIGCLGEDGDNHSYHGNYDKTKSIQYHSYMKFYEDSEFLLHPARFDASPIVTSEAAAFGTPTITNNSGGLSTSVEHGISGIVLPQGSAPIRYVNAILELMNNPKRYFDLCKTTRLRYEKDLHWDVAGAKINRLLNRCAKS